MRYRVLSAFWDGPVLHEPGAEAQFPESAVASLLRSGKIEAIEERVVLPAPKPASKSKPKPEPVHIPES
jgi:hypothetical protein